MKPTFVEQLISATLPLDGFWLKIDLQHSRTQMSLFSLFSGVTVSDSGVPPAHGDATADKSSLLSGSFCKLFPCWRCDFPQTGLWCEWSSLQMDKATVSAALKLYFKHIDCKCCLQVVGRMIFLFYLFFSFQNITIWSRNCTQHCIILSIVIFHF